ncbi:hypothetical protein [Chitinimonas koreensis]|uniref:hypothetical protein n=1 Tax=Chitinimonas koreensis TaxID=356302 RepID=UPI0003F823E3|nr:hypothetical protein [Chitinimonas koreensis]QNM98479.1 hypothetical protein H9L41_09740 [Chitinimonas koreensis]
MSGTRHLRRGLLALAAAATLGRAAAAERLDVYGEPYPPFLLDRQGTLAGPYAEAFAALLRQQGIEARFVSMPVKRLMLQLESQPNSCGLALNFAPGAAETLNYLGRVAPITVSVYANAGQSVRLSNIEDLRRYRVGAIDIAELRDLLDTAGIAYEPLAQSSRGFSMLGAHRFDLLLSDLLPELDAGGAGIVRVFTLARFERWVACNSGIAPATAGKLRKALAEGLFAQSVQPIWARYRLQAYYDDVRDGWVAIPKARSGRK